MYSIWFNNSFVFSLVFLVTYHILDKKKKQIKKSCLRYAAPVIQRTRKFCRQYSMAKLIHFFFQPKGKWYRCVMILTDVLRERSSLFCIHWLMYIFVTDIINNISLSYDSLR